MRPAELIWVFTWQSQVLVENAMFCNEGQTMTASVWEHQGVAVQLQPLQPF